MRGVIELPLEQGKKELCWFVGTAVVDTLVGASAVNPTINLTTSRDADFVAKRWWLVDWPSFTPTNKNLPLPDDTSVILREGSTRRALSLVAGFARAMFPDADPQKMAAAMLGLPAPYLVRANTNLLMEVSRPSAAATAWKGDLLFIMEGFKVYPYLPEDIPATIKAYSIPFTLDGNQVVNDPSLTPGAIAGQVLTITNDGSGKFLAKRMRVRIVDSTGVDVTDALTPMMAFNLKDSTSGDKAWVTNNTPGVQAFVPVGLFTMGDTDLFWNTPRYIDPSGNVKVAITFSANAAALVVLHAAAVWPVTLNVSLDGALLPR